MQKPFSRYSESQLRQFLSILGVDEDSNPDDVAARLDRLRRGLEPEDEISLALAWLGRCRLVHKLGQEQLPIVSADSYKVPDLLAVFDVGKKSFPVLIEVKKHEPKVLKFSRGYARYAELIGLPLLVAWQRQTFWTLFDIREAATPSGHYKIDFPRAMEQNLLMFLAGDFSYRIAPGTGIRMRIKKVSPPDDKGGFEGVIQDVHCINPAGEMIPDIPLLSSLLLFWDNEVEEVDEGDAIVQSFIVPVPDLEYGEFATRTLGKLLHGEANISPARTTRPPVNWRKVMHETTHWVHNSGEFLRIVNQGAEHGIFTHVLREPPRTLPAFLREDI